MTSALLLNDTYRKNSLALGSARSYLVSSETSRPRKSRHRTSTAKRRCLTQINSHLVKWPRLHAKQLTISKRKSVHIIGAGTVTSIAATCRVRDSFQKIPALEVNLARPTRTNFHGRHGAMSTDHKENAQLRKSYHFSREANVVCIDVKQPFI